MGSAGSSVPGREFSRKGTGVVAGSKCATARSKGENRIQLETKNSYCPVEWNQQSKSSVTKLVVWPPGLLAVPADDIRRRPRLAQAGRRGRQSGMFDPKAAFVPASVLERERE